MPRILIILTLLCFPGLLKSQNYLWPTNASNYLTSSFCEYRPGHYHSAIDIKTWNREGYPVYAVEDGEIVRVRVSPFGYGKVIYLKLKDGNIAVYAHLQKFNPEMDQAVRERQIEKQKYSINWQPSKWTVKKGDILGYSGQTGIGVPHLHFEIRDSKERPLNPLKFYDKVQDNIPPTLQSLLIIPLTPQSAVNGSFVPAEFNLSYIRDGEYQINEPLFVKGKIGFALRGYDMADGVHNSFAFYKTELKVNDIDYFRMLYDRIDFDLTNQIDVEIYYPFRAWTGKVFHKLYIETFNDLEFYDRSLGDGSIEVNTDPIEFRIDVSDFFGNARYIKGTLLPDGAASPKIKLINRTNNLAYLRMELPSKLTELRFSASSDGRTWNNIEFFEILERSYSNPHQDALLKIMLPSGKDHYLKTMVTTSDNQQIENITRMNGPVSSTIFLDVLNMGKNLALRFNQINDSPGLSLNLDNETSSEIYLPVIRNDYFEKIVSAAKISGENLSVRLLDNEQTILDTTLIIKRLLPGADQKIGFVGGHVNLRASVSSLYDTLLVTVGQKVLDASLINAPVFSSIYEIDPFGLKLKDNVFLTIAPDSFYSDISKMGIYSLAKSNKLSYAGAIIDTLNKTISADISAFGTFLVAADTTAPELRVIYPRDNSRLTTLDKIQFYTKDHLSGIEKESNIRILLDGRFVIPEWDPEKDIITGYPHWNPGKGNHLITITVKDLAGNTIENTISITIL
ncbi:MAG: peptidoglycan DD-metalloendopeptidase family protein [Calditrichaceae bacterium]